METSSIEDAIGSNHLTHHTHLNSPYPNTPTCAYCTGPRPTKDCNNLQQPPKCNTCGSKHPTFSYKCKSRPEPNFENLRLAVPIRIPEPAPQTPPITSMSQPITISQFLTFITVVLQNLYPFQRHEVLNHLQFAARTVLNANLLATYSGPYVLVHTHPLETAV